MKEWMREEGAGQMVGGLSDLFTIHSFIRSLRRVEPK